MSLTLDYEKLGNFKAEYSVRRTVSSQLPPITLSINAGLTHVQDYLTSAEARKLAYALIEQANVAENPSLAEAA